MKIVKEHIQFKRGLDPKKGLNIGRYRKIENPTEEDFIRLAPGKYRLTKTSYDGKRVMFIYGKIPKYRKTFGMRMNGTWQYSLEELEEYDKKITGVGGTVFWNLNNIDRAITSIQRME